MKGLDVLELLAERGTALSMKEIAGGLGRSKNEIFRMLVALQERNYIERDPKTDAYSLTDRLFTLGLRTPKARDLLLVAMPEMVRLAEETRQSPHLVVIDQGETVVVAVVPGGDDMSFTLKLGYRRVATDATSGNVLLAFQAPDTRERMIAESAARAARPPDIAELGRTLAEIRSRGYEMRESRDFVGITDICCPVFGADRKAQASVILCYVNRQGRPNRQQAALEQLRAACERMSARLSGWTAEAVPTTTEQVAAPR
jgi:DNA-binding IclR family transcriptional regulator